jgi:hypothetical protein
MHGDSIQALAAGIMMIMIADLETVIIEAHSKAWNVKRIDELMGFAFDPVYNRPLHETPRTMPAQRAEILAAHEGNATKNQENAIGMEIAGASYALSSEPISLPLHGLIIAAHTNGALGPVLVDKITQTHCLSNNCLMRKGICPTPLSTLTLSQQNRFVIDWQIA